MNQSYSTRASAVYLTCACILSALTAASAQPANRESAKLRDETQSEDIVVTARRSGIPVWRVSGPRSTIVLVGAIGHVSRDTRWDPGSLTAALLKADRVMFPGAVGVNIGFSAIGYLPKLLKMRTLPKGQSLQGLLSPDQFARLVALKNRGVLKAGFERSHPLFLAAMLRGAAEGGKKGLGPDPVGFVRRFAKKNKLKLVPITMMKAKPIATDLFASTPRSHVPCLLDAIALAEAGPGAVKLRSDAWAERRVPAVLASTAERMERSCWPAGTELDRSVDQGLRRSVRQILTQPQITVAVVKLSSLAERGGVLDDLASAGFDIRGPKWR